MKVLFRVILLLAIIPVAWLLPTVYVQEYEGTVLNFDDGSTYVIRLESGDGVLRHTACSADINVFGSQISICLDDVGPDRLMVNVTGLTECKTGDYVRVSRLSSRYSQLRMRSSDFWNKLFKYWVIPQRGYYGPYFAGSEPDPVDFFEFPKPIIHVGLGKVTLLKAYEPDDSVVLSDVDRLRLSEYYMSPVRLGGLDSNDIIWSDD